MRKAQLVLVMALGVGLILLFGGLAQATLVQKDSTEFVHKYEATSGLPEAEDTGSNWDCNHGGGWNCEIYPLEDKLTMNIHEAQIYHFWYGRTAGGDYNVLGANYTIEAKVQIESQQGTGSLFEILSMSGSKRSILDIFTNSVTWNGITYSTANNSDDLHTFRVACANGTDYSLWRDGALIDTTSGSDGTSATFMYFGKTSETCLGITNLHYYRWDSTGAYAPVPEPMTVGLFTLAGLLIRGRWA